MSEELKNNKHNPIDGFFKDALTDHKMKPSARVWKGIRSAYLNPLFKTKSVRNGLYFVSAVLIMLIGGAYLLTSSGPEDNPEISQANIDISENKIQVSVKEKPEIKDQEPVISEVSNDEEINTKEIANSKEEEVDMAITDDEEKTITEVETVSPEPLQNSTNNEQNFRNSYSMFKLAFLSVSAIDMPLESLSLSKLDIDFNKVLPKDDYARKANLQFGAHAGVGYNYYKDRSKKEYYSGELNISYQVSKVWAETGFGVHHEKDNGDFIINYESYDSVGYFYNITSFSYDPATEQVVFNKEIENVYDSIEHKTLRNTTTQYTYLQIPLGLKYQILDLKRVDLYARIGGIYQLLINKNEPEVNAISSDVYVNSMYNEVPSRLSSSWKFYAGMQFRYMLRSKLWLEIEPVYMQYLQTPYENKNGFDMKRPYSIGLRTGVSFNF